MSGKLPQIMKRKDRSWDDDCDGAFVRVLYVRKYKKFEETTQSKAWLRTLKMD